MKALVGMNLSPYYKYCIDKYAYFNQTMHIEETFDNKSLQKATLQNRLISETVINNLKSMENTGGGSNSSMHSGV